MAFWPTKQVKSKAETCLTCLLTTVVVSDQKSFRAPIRVEGKVRMSWNRIGAQRKERM
jgi:hypothetical protein